MKFLGVENTVAKKLSQKVDENMIFIDYWKVLVLNFSGMKNTVFFETKVTQKMILLITEMLLFWIFRGWKIRSFFWDKKLMERWCLLVTEKLLSSAFRWWKIRFFLEQKVNGKMIFTDYWKVLVLVYWRIRVLSFLVMGNTVFF